MGGVMGGVVGGATGDIARRRTMPGVGSLAEARKIRDEADIRLRGHPPERRETRAVEGLRELAHPIRREAREDVLRKHD